MFCSQMTSYGELDVAWEPPVYSQSCIIIPISDEKSPSQLDRKASCQSSVKNLACIYYG